MRKQILLGLLLISLLLLSSCTGPGGTGISWFNKNPNKFRPYAGINYHEGTDGLVFDFLSQSPPFTVFEGTEFDVQAIIHNNGAFSVAERYAATLTLIYDNNLVELVTSQAPAGYVNDGEIQLYGRSYYYPSGEMNYFPLERFRVKPFDTQHETKTIKFTALLTYPYQTHFSDSICIDTDPEEISPRQKACHVSDKRYSRGQGAPIAITGVESQMIPRGYYVQPQFTIHIEHRGDGLIWNFDENGFTSGNLNPLNQIVPQIVDLSSQPEPNLIQARAYLGVDELRCSPVYMKEGKAKIQCILPENTIAGSASNYETTLSVNLSYFYQESFSKEVEVKRSTVIDVEQDPLTPADYCAPWEEYRGITEGCVSKCKIYAAENQGELVTMGLKNKDYWQYVDCTYTDPNICRRYKGSCIVESKDICMTGTYCGWPSCLEYNVPPSLNTRSDHVWTEGETLRFVCIDNDDYYDKKSTCGCSEKAYFATKGDGERCDEIPEGRFAILIGEQTQYGMTFRLEGAANNKDLCVMFEDKLGVRSVPEAIPNYIRD